MEKKNLLVFAIALLGIVGWMVAIYSFYVKEEAVDKFSDNHSYNYIRATVWYHSRGKLEELKSILQVEDLSKQEQVKMKINNMLRHRSSAYIRDFNSLDAPVPNLGNVYEKVFDFDAFLEGVYAVCFDESLTVDARISLVANVMEKYQMEANDKVLSIMKGEMR